MQSIAAENNLAETAFFVAEGEGDVKAYGLRWFTPTTEVDLCGHATLAAAWVLFNELGHSGQHIRFDSRSGILKVSRTGERLTLDFPSKPALQISAPSELLTAFAPEAVYKVNELGGNWLVVVDEAATVRDYLPDFAAIAAIKDGGVIMTAAGDTPDVDFVSRYFAPNYGIDEDPVTGSAHCTLVPYWAERLGKTVLEARQVSARGGELSCRLADGRVEISGQAVLTLRGELVIPD